MLDLSDITFDEFTNILNENKAMNESLAYAWSMQRGILPKRRHFERIWDKTTVFYRPKGIVSGDFYYIGSNGDHIYWAVGDCSGHGVPGAMLTMLGWSFLNYAIQNKNGLPVNEVLHEMDKKLCETFQFSETPEHIDISLFSYNPKTQMGAYSGARRKLIHIRDGEVTVIKGNSYPLGGLQIEKHRKYDLIEVEIKEGDFIYVGSDGYQDQFGGPQGKKYTSKRLHRLLGEISHYEIFFQKIILLQEFQQWKKGLDQVDDVCLMGVAF